jgi:flavin-dependent dehydrogenase
VISEFDVAVVGAGPAGTAAAIWSVRKGLKTVLLEVERFPRDRPGETLHPGIEVLFDQLGVSDAILKAGFPRHRGHLVRWRRNLEFQEFGRDARGPWLGFHAWRSELDSILLQHAAKGGAIVRQPCRAVAPILSAGRIAGLYTSTGDVVARFVVDASGGRHWLQRHTKIKLTRATRSLIAAYGYSRVPPERIGTVPLILRHANGWTWMAPVKPGVLAWTQLALDGSSSTRPEWLDEFESLGPIRGADVTWRIVEPCAGSGYFIAGDSACVTDPANSHGVIKAVMSGMLAADLISRIAQREISETSAASMFSNWTARWFDSDTRNLEHLYSRMGLGYVFSRAEFAGK